MSEITPPPGTSKDFSQHLREVIAYTKGEEDHYASRPMQDQKEFTDKYGAAAWEAYCKGYKEIKP